MLFLILFASFLKFWGHIMRTRPMDAYRWWNSMYRNKNGNLPWAMDVTGNIPYLKEGYNFNKGYVKFVY